MESKQANTRKKKKKRLLTILLHVLSPSFLFGLVILRMAGSLAF
jgi:flagellar basal body-associated protein FliL